MSKVEFDGENLIISINNNIREIDVIIDLYSEWKRWVLISDNSKFFTAMRSIGGQEISPGKFISGYIELLNGWRIKPQDGNYTLSVIGNIFVNGGDSPFLSANSGSVLINMISTSNSLSLESGDCEIGYGFI